MIESLTGLFRWNVCADEVVMHAKKSEEIQFNFKTHSKDTWSAGELLRFGNWEMHFVHESENFIFYSSSSLSINFHFTLGSEYRLEKALFTFRVAIVIKLTAWCAEWEQIQLRNVWFVQIFELYCGALHKAFVSICLRKAPLARCTKRLQVDEEFQPSRVACTIYLKSYQNLLYQLYFLKKKAFWAVKHFEITSSQSVKRNQNFHRSHRQPTTESSSSDWTRSVQFSYFNFLSRAGKTCFDLFSQFKGFDNFFRLFIKLNSQCALSYVRQLLLKPPQPSRNAQSRLTSHHSMGKGLGCIVSQPD